MWHVSPLAGQRETTWSAVKDISGGAGCQRPEGSYRSVGLDELLDNRAHSKLTLPDEFFYLSAVSQDMDDGVLQQTFHVIDHSPPALDDCF